MAIRTADEERRSFSRWTDRVPHTQSDSSAGSRGLTLLEVLFTLGIVGILAAIAVEAYDGALGRARVTRAIADIRVVEEILTTMEVESGLPESLLEIGWADRTDPWGRPYQYLRFEGQKSLPGKVRKDRFLVPLNTSYDLFSMGPDGESKGPLTAAVSRDDIVRAADGAFVGLAIDF